MSRKTSPKLFPVDTFIGVVPIDEDRIIVVYRRRHRRKDYIRWRTWHCHKTKRLWYPDVSRRFLVPLEHAEALAQAIASAVHCKPVSAMPQWLADAENGRDESLGILKELNAPESVVMARECTKGRAYGEGPKRRRSKLRTG